MKTTYVTRTPIHGYMGCGYENQIQVERKHLTIEAAGTYRDKCDAYFEIYGDCGARRDKFSDDKFSDEDAEEVTDRTSFTITGKTSIFKIETTETRIA